MLVEVYVDPACGWSQVTVRWLQSVAPRRQVELRLLPYSLLLRDGLDGQPPPRLARRRASLRALRVMETVAGRDPAEVRAFWDHVVAQDGPVPFADLEVAATRAGVGSALASADDEGVDVALSTRMTAADALTGAPAVLPLLVLDGRVAFTGPLLRHPPEEGAPALALWDGVVSLAATGGFYELSRPRPPHPALPGLPPVPVPPVLAADVTSGALARLVRGYLARVVNRRDVTAVDELVAPGYVGGGFGWPADRDQLRRFYLDQMRDRPDWRVDVQETVEVGDSVVVRALAGGTVVGDGASVRRDVEWLAQYRVEDGRIREIRLLSVVPRDPPAAVGTSRQTPAASGSQA